jgi:hypothetical protein
MCFSFKNIQLANAANFRGDYQMAFGTEFWSAISGAVVGGVIALLIQLVALNAAKKERALEKKDKREALARSAMFKALRIRSNLFVLHSYIEKSFATANSDTHNEPWTFLLPLANSPADVHFSTDEMTLILSFNNRDLTDLLMSLDVVHNSLIDVFETYRDMRADIQQSMPAKMVGNVGTTSFTPEELALVQPKMVMMNQLIGDARIRAKTDYEESQQAVDKLLASINDKLKLGIEIEFKAEKLQKVRPQGT